MRWFKKIVRAILALIPVFSIFFVPSVSALQYGISGFSIQSDPRLFVHLSDNNYGYYNDNRNLYVSMPSDSVPQNFTFPHVWHFAGQYNDGTCTMRSYSDGVYSGVSGSGSNQLTYYYLSSSNNDRPLDLYYLPPNLFASPLTGSYVNDDLRKNSLCNIYNYSYYSSSDPSVPSIDTYAPKWDWGSLINIPLVNNRAEFEKSKPYFYQYNMGVLSSTAVSEGVHFTHNGLKISDLFKSVPTKINQLSLQFPLFKDPTYRLDWGSPEGDIYHAQIEGRIMFDDDFIFNNTDHSGVFLSVNDFSNYSIENRSPDYTLSDYNLYDISSSVVHSDIKCSVDINKVSNGDSSNQIYFRCPYSSDKPIDFNFYDFGVYLYSNSGPVLSSSGDYTLVDFSLVSNHDYTPTDWETTPHVTGGNDDVAPGGINDSSDSSQPDWFLSLSNLFGFSFINPFAPLLMMFSNQNSCAQIPTLAGMLHAESSEVCPFFPSEVRQITTPVLSIASVMLIFGFAVRWLGASSGNMFEDTSNETLVPPNNSGTWGRRKK